MSTFCPAPKLRGRCRQVPTVSAETPHGNFGALWEMQTVSPPTRLLIGGNMSVLYSKRFGHWMRRYEAREFQ